MQDYGQAYDFKIFQSNTAKKQSTVIELPNVQLRRKAKYKQKLKFWTVCFSAFLTVGLGISGFLFSQAKLAEYTHSAILAEKKLEEFKSQNEQLQVQLASNSKFVNYENSDVNSKEDYVEVVTISTGDKAELN